MSHLTASILNRPLAYNHTGAFEFPLPRPVHPLSPPDTEEDFAIGAQPRVSMPMPRPSGLGLEVEPPMQQHQAPTIQDTPGSRFRKISYLAASGARDGRERPAQPRSKWLVVVIPPASIAQQHGQLGHTLSQGPSSRLSNGVLMPLFPTMYAQLTAIAREFNFPSTTGVCLYLHMVEQGMTFTPRVSDESWQLLWNHLFDARSPAAPSGLPIGGRLEFDIDRRQARWFEPWLASSQRHSGEFSPGRAPSIYHGLHAHHDSRTEDMEEDDNGSVAPRGKSHVPRKLSLVDRFDTMSVRSARGGAARPSFIGGFVAPTSQEVPVHPLATISQADEPKTAKDVLENRVKSWRESASLQPSLLAATGQPSLEPANLPNSVEVPDVDESGELNLLDFTWSISSAGPPSDVLSPIDWWSPVASPHMDRRAEGSVLLTPTTMSSLGPLDYAAEWSPISYMDRLPSPDMAWRQLDDVPPTPTTVSSRGPADYEITWSPPSYYRSASPDIAWRMMEDVPPTPTTASSMGPPEFWPPSPRMEFRATTPDIGQRGGWSLPVTPMHASFPQTAAWSHVWPYTDAPRTWSQVWPYNAPTESVQTWGHVWPYNNAAPATWEHVWPYANATPATWDHVWPYNANAGESLAATETWNHVFPYTTADSRASMFKHVFPYHTSQQTAVAAVEKTGYPYFNLYPAVAVSSVKRVHEPRIPGYPYALQVYKPAYPHFDIYPAAAASALSGRQQEIIVKAPTAYPIFDLYPAVYPWFDVYPADQRRQQAPVTVEYPALHVYYTLAPCQPIRRPGVAIEYPFFDIYPARAASSSVIKQHSYGYPWFNIYMEIRPEGLTKGYPCIEPYPAVARSASRSVTKQHAYGYPWFNIYSEMRPEGVSVAYPCIEPYPAITRAASPLIVKGHAYGYPWFNVYSEMRPEGLAVAYPCIEPYPAVARATSSLVVKTHAYGYPWFMIYSEVRPEGLPVAYPCIEIYPAVRRPSAIKVLDFVSAYPNIIIYPSSRSTTKPATRSFQLVALTGVRVNWPLIEIYPSVSRSAKSHGANGYPHLVIYPAGKAIDDSRHFGNNKSAHVSMSLGYPTMVIYPAVYPTLDIYPLVSRPNEDAAKNLGIYPAMVIYGVNYPRFGIYPSVMQPVEPPHLLSVKLTGYPTISIYTPLYPSFRIYDVIGKQEEQENVSVPITTQLLAKYPAISLYQPLYPRIELYPAVPALQPLYSRPESKATSNQLPQPARAPLPARPSAPLVTRKVAQVAKWIPRKSHGQLRFEVMSEAPIRMAPVAKAPIRQISVRQTPRSTPWIPRRSHAQLHGQVFPEGIVATPTAMYEIMRSSSPSRSPATLLPSRPALPSALPSSPAPLRRPSLNARPRSGTINARPAVTVPIATPSNPSPEAVARMSPVSRKLPPPAAVPTRALPARPIGLPAGPRRISVAPRPASVFTSEPSSHIGVAPLSPLGEDEVADRSRTVRPAYDSLARSRSTNENNRPGAPSHVRRVSLVQERAKAYDTNNMNKPQIMSTLNQFPLPPAPPLPSNGLPTVSRLDRSKFAAFSGSPT